MVPTPCKPRAALLAAPLLASSLLLGGCLVTSGQSIDERGVRITGKTLNQVELGTTSESWLRAALGEPTSAREIAGESDGDPTIKILRYDHIVKKSSAGTVFLLFSGGSESKRTTSTFFELQDGVVVRYWTEAENV